MPFVELHGRSAFSFLRGASLPEEYAETAAKLEIPAMALLDRDGVYGSPRFFAAMKKHNLRGHTGAEVLCTDGSYYPLLVKSRTGYQNLCRLITRTKLRTAKHPKPGEEAAATPEEFVEFSKGLICLTGDGDGPLASAIRRGEGRACLDRLTSTFGPGNVYAEIQRHRDRDEEARNQAVIALARSMEVPLVATNGVCHVQPASREILDVFTCLHHKVTLKTAGRLLTKRERPDCIHPCLEPILKRTLGVPLFQEQLLRIAMTAANFTGGEAEELRRAMGFKRSKARMQVIEVRLREGMTKNGITGETQDTIVGSITAFAKYGFPEAHAASFALLAYASAFLKVHFLGAFTCAMLNNQPMGFYAPSILVKDAQRHGLRVIPIDITKSEWDCTLEDMNLRLGLRYVKGLRVDSGSSILRERTIAPFADIDDFARRVPALHKDEMAKLAAAGALNPLNAAHRRDALWQSSRAARTSGPLLSEVPENDPQAPLQPMTIDERLIADYSGTGINIGCHPMFYHRAEMNALGVTTTAGLAGIRSGKNVRIAGCVIVRQRPGTAKGIVFLSLEDETGIGNVVVMPDVFDANKLLIVGTRWLLIEGPIQNVDNVIHVRAKRIEPLGFSAASIPSHDFH